MSRSPAFRNLARAIRIARFCEENNISTGEGLERTALEAQAAAQRAGRREFLANTGKLAVVGAIGSVLPPLRLALAFQRRGPAVRVGIVGAGLSWPRLRRRTQ